MADTGTGLPCQCLHCTTPTGAPAAWRECSHTSTPPSAPCDCARVSKPAWANSCSTTASKRRHSMAANTSALHCVNRSWAGLAAGVAGAGVGGAGSRPGSTRSSPAFRIRRAAVWLSVAGASRLAPRRGAVRAGVGGLAVRNLSTTRCKATATAPNPSMTHPGVRSPALKASSIGLDRSMAGTSSIPRPMVIRVRPMESGVPLGLRRRMWWRVLDWSRKDSEGPTPDRVLAFPSFTSIRCV